MPGLKLPARLVLGVTTACATDVREGLPCQLPGGATQVCRDSGGSAELRQSPWSWQQQQTRRAEGMLSIGYTKMVSISQYRKHEYCECCSRKE